MEGVNPVVNVREDAFDNEPATNPAVSATTLSGTDADREVSDVGHDVPEGSKIVERDYYNPLDGTRGRLGGVYLDTQERAEAEELRAKSEDREPDYENMPATAGQTLVTKERLVDNVFSNPSSDPIAPVEKVDPVSTLGTDIGIAAPDVDTTYADQVSAENQAANRETNPTGDTAEQGATPDSNPDNSTLSNVQTY